VRYNFTLLQNRVPVAAGLNAAQAIDTTSPMPVQITEQFSVANAGNIITLNTCVIELVV
jgi:hypothetical protein